MAKILVVDDSVTLRQMASAALIESGHTVSVAENGEVALAMLSEFQPDVVLTDMYMPGIDGISLTREIRRLPAYERTPILVLTTDSSEEAKTRGKENGVTGWITKPFDPEKLQFVISKVLH